MDPFTPINNLGWICSAIISILGFATLVFQQWHSTRDRRRQVASSKKDIGSKIDENTEISARAFNEANNFNRKLEQIRAGQEQLIDRVQKIESDFVSGVKLEGHLEKIESLLDARTGLIEKFNDRLDKIEERLTRIEQVKA